MKELVLVRHAKSDRENHELHDIDRPLNARGYADAYRMSAWFKANGKMPNRVLSSPATRALSTALIFARSLNIGEAQVVLEPEIYEASAEDLLRVLRRQPAKAEYMLMFGHNPGFTELCNRLSGHSRIDNLPTCGLMAFQFPVKDWKDLRIGLGQLSYYQFPKTQGSLS